MKFLPSQLNDAELVERVREAISETGAAGPKDMGKVMKAVLPKVEGRADGQRISACVKTALGS